MPQQPPPQQPRPEAISHILRQLLTAVAGGGVVTIGNMLAIFGVRGFAVLFLVLAILNVVIFMIPGISVLFGLPMVILAMQMIFGVPQPIFPAFIRRRVIKRSVLRNGLATGIRYAEKIEPYIKPRFLFLSEHYLTRVHSLLALFLAVMVTLPVPLLNVPPSFGIIALAIGVVQRDGIFIMAAYAIAFWSFWLFQSVGHVAHSLVT